MDNWVFVPVVGIMIPIVAIIGAFTYIIVRTLAQSRVRELEVRERIAMIERGLVPAPEADPKGFEKAMAVQRMHQEGPPSSGASRHRRLGITLMGVGFGLMLLIGIAAGNPQGGIGVGGFLVVLGVAFFVNSVFDHRHAASQSSSDSVPPR